MHDLKDEGNALFKEGHYDIAWMHYRNAIFVARILDTRFYHSVDKEFLSSLFSNRAFCCLKKVSLDLIETHYFIRYIGPDTVFTYNCQHLE